MVKGRAQLAFCCPCGRPEILVLGLCATCYTLKRQGEEYFGGATRSGARARRLPLRGRGAPGREKRSIIVPHHVPGVSRLELMISLSPGCHSKVERTKMVLAEMTPLLLELWREQHLNATNKSSWPSTREGQQRKQLRWHSTVNVPEPIVANRNALLLANGRLISDALQTLRA